jgi:hypothetical protein
VLPLSLGRDVSAEGAGGESGGPPERALVTRTSTGWAPKPEAVEWVRELRDACHARGVAFLHKQGWIHAKGRWSTPGSSNLE